MLQLSELPLDIFKELAECSLNEFLGFVPNDISSKHTFSNQEVNELIVVFKSIYTQLAYSILNCEDLFKIFDDEKTNFITDIFHEYKHVIATALLKENNAEIKDVLENYDWRVKWIIGSSMSSSLRYPLLQLDLSIVSKSEDVVIRKTVSCELNVNELDKLILELERINESI